MSLDTWRTIALSAAAVGQTAFVSLYLTFPWWKTFLGRALFFKALALCVVVDAYVIFRINSFGNSDAIFVCLYAVLAVGVWAQFLAFLRVRLRRRHDSVVSGNGVER